ISQAVVADLPVPVAPSRTTSVSPALTRSASALIAAGWSPEGSNSLTTVKRPCVGRRSVVVRTRRRYDAGVTERVRARPGARGTPVAAGYLSLTACPPSVPGRSSCARRGPAPPGLAGRGRTPASAALSAGRPPRPGRTCARRPSRPAAGGVVVQWGGWTPRRAGRGADHVSRRAIQVCGTVDRGTVPSDVCTAPLRRTRTRGHCLQHLEGDRRRNTA